MRSCNHRVSSTTSSQTGPSWPPSRSGLTQQGRSYSPSVLATPPCPRLPASTGSTRSVSNCFGLLFVITLKCIICVCNNMTCTRTLSSTSSSSASPTASHRSWPALLSLAPSATWQICLAKMWKMLSQVDQLWPSSPTLTWYDVKTIQLG